MKEYRTKVANFTIQNRKYEKQLGNIFEMGNL